MTDGLIRISPPRRGPRLDLTETWTYRELLYFLMWRDIKVRYKQTGFGAAWALLQPLGLMVVFSLFLGKLARVPSEGVPYPIFVLAGLVPWTFFAQSTSAAANSLVENSNLVSKIYFPRLLLPLSAAASFLLDFVIAFIVLMVMMLFFSVSLSMSILWIPLFACLALATSLSVGVGLAAVNAKYRDVRYALPFLLQIWLFLSPVAYATSLVPSEWRAVYGLNPMVVVIDGFRWAVLGVGGAPLMESAIGVVILLIAGGLGLSYFQATERTMADVI